MNSLYSKTSCRLGLLKRTLYFIKCPKQKRNFYQAIVRSQFEHCIQIWRPNNDTYIAKLERIQRRAVKWILAEYDHHYNELEYVKRLKDLDLLPLRYRFIFSDLTMFYKIYYNKTSIALPEYYKPISNDDMGRLRKNIKPPEYLSGNETINLKHLRKIKNDSLSLKCITEAHSCVFKNSFFFRTVHEWNRVPTEIRSVETLAQFESGLKSYLWKQALYEMEPD